MTSYSTLCDFKPRNMSIRIYLPPYPLPKNFLLSNIKICILLKHNVILILHYLKQVMINFQKNAKTGNKNLQ
jgi:hypothetical protein